MLGENLSPTIDSLRISANVVAGQMATTPSSPPTNPVSPIVSVPLRTSKPVQSTVIVDLRETAMARSTHS